MKFTQHGQCGRPHQRERFLTIWLLVALTCLLSGCQKPVEQVRLKKPEPVKREIDSILYHSAKLSLEIHSDGRWTKSVSNPEKSTTAGRLDPAVVKPLLSLIGQCQEGRMEHRLQRPPADHPHYVRGFDSTEYRFVYDQGLLVTSGPEGSQCFRSSDWTEDVLLPALLALPLVEPVSTPGSSRLKRHLPHFQVCGNGTPGGHEELLLDSSGVVIESVKHDSGLIKTAFVLDRAETDQIFEMLEKMPNASQREIPECEGCEFSGLFTIPPFEFESEEGHSLLHSCQVDPVLSRLNQRKAHLFSPWIVQITAKKSGRLSTLSVLEARDPSPVFQALQTAFEEELSETGSVELFYGEPADGSFYVRYLAPDYPLRFRHGWIEADKKPEAHALLTRLTSSPDTP